MHQAKGDTAFRPVEHESVSKLKLEDRYLS